MASIRATAIAHPPHRYDQNAILDSLALWLGADERLLPLAQRVFANAAVRTRYGCHPLFDLINPPSFARGR